MMHAREEFPRGFIKSVKWLSRIEEGQKPGRFVMENLCHIIKTLVLLRNTNKRIYLKHLKVCSQYTNIQKYKYTNIGESIL